MLKKLLYNKKGTAEVIGSVMFIVILMFFFTNVYLWHDAAVKEMNDLYSEKLNSPISISYDVTTNTLLIKNLGGVDATIECYWVDHKMTEIPDTWADPDKVVLAGGRPLAIHLRDDPSEYVKVVTTLGNTATDSDFTV